jgi:hypothetical protein
MVHSMSDWYNLYNVKKKTKLHGLSPRANYTDRFVQCYRRNQNCVFWNSVDITAFLTSVYNFYFELWFYLCLQILGLSYRGRRRISYAQLIAGNILNSSSIELWFAGCHESNMQGAFITHKPPSSTSPLKSRGLSSRSRQQTAKESTVTTTSISTTIFHIKTIRFSQEST